MLGVLIGALVGFAFAPPNLGGKAALAGAIVFGTILGVAGALLGLRKLEESPSQDG